MPFFAILIDILAFGAYSLQRQNPSHGLYVLGIIVEVILTVVLLIMTFTYNGRRRSRFRNYDTWTHNFTFRYAIIVLSMIINAVVLVLYFLNITGRNPLIFS